MERASRYYRSGHDAVSVSNGSLFRSVLGSIILPAHGDDMRLPIPATPQAPAGTRRSLVRSELALMLVLATLIVAFTLVRLRAAVVVYFPVDAARYTADADALLGNGVRENQHPLLFPMLIALTRPWLDVIAAYLVAISLTLFLLPIGLYALLRQWFPPVGAVAGAVSGTLTPAVGEALGWAGGATLAATVASAFTLAAMEWWARADGRQGFLVGIGLALVLNGHPFVAMITAPLIGGLWLLAVAARWRRRGGWSRWGPASWRGIASVSAPVGVGVLFALPYYTMVQTSGSGLQPPDFARSWALLRGVSRENEVVLLALLALGLLLPLALRRGRTACVTLALGALLLVFPAVMANHISYLARPLYFTPLVIAVAACCLVELVRRGWRRSRSQLHSQPSPLTSLAIGLGAALLMTTIGGFGTRVVVAARYYAVLTDQSDVRLIRRLAEAQGTIVTSWYGVQYDVGATSAWLVEALARRRAYGPAARWVSTIQESEALNATLQRFFAGATGMENGALQLVESELGAKRDPALNVQVAGYYYPLLFVDNSLGDFPLTVGQATATISEPPTMTFLYQSATGQRIRQTVLLDGATVTLTWRYDTDEPVEPWSLWLWDAFGRFTRVVTSDEQTLVARRRILDREIEFTIAVPPEQGRLAYYQYDPRFGLPGTAVRFSGQEEASLTITVAGVEPTTLRQFTQEEAISRFQISDVLVWKESGAAPAFNQSPCFALADQSARLLLYRVVPENCRLGQ